MGEYDILPWRCYVQQATLPSVGHKEGIDLTVTLVKNSYIQHVAYNLSLEIINCVEDNFCLA